MNYRDLNAAGARAGSSAEGATPAAGSGDTFERFFSDYADTRVIRGTQEARGKRARSLPGAPVVSTGAASGRSSSDVRVKQQLPGRRRRRHGRSDHSLPAADTRADRGERDYEVVCTVCGSGDHTADHHRQEPCGEDRDVRGSDSRGSETRERSRDGTEVGNFLGRERAISWHRRSDGSYQQPRNIGYTRAPWWQMRGW